MLNRFKLFRLKNFKGIYATCFILNPYKVCNKSIIRFLLILTVLFSMYLLNNILTFQLKSFWKYLHCLKYIKFLQTYQYNHSFLLLFEIYPTEFKFRSKAVLFGVVRGKRKGRRTNNQWNRDKVWRVEPWYPVRGETDPGWGWQRKRSGISWNKWSNKYVL